MSEYDQYAVLLSPQGASIEYVPRDIDKFMRCKSYRTPIGWIPTTVLYHRLDNRSFEGIESVARKEVA